MVVNLPPPIENLLHMKILEKKNFQAFKYRGSKNSVHCFCSMKSLRKQKQWRDKNRPYKFKLDFRQISGSTKNWRKRGQGGFCSTI